jgi:hypothetical protein
MPTAKGYLGSVGTAREPESAHDRDRARGRRVIEILVVTYTTVGPSEASVSVF